MAYVISANSIMYFPLRIINFIINCIHCITLDLQWSKFSKVENWKGYLIQTCHLVHCTLFSIVKAFFRKKHLSISCRLCLVQRLLSVLRTFLFHYYSEFARAIIIISMYAIFLHTLYEQKLCSIDFVLIDLFW